MLLSRTGLPAIVAAVALAVPAAAGAATTVGSALTATPESSATCGAATFTNTALATGTLHAPFDGVIVRWRLKMAAAGGSFAYKLRVLRPAGGSTYTGAGTGPGQTAPSVGTNVIVLPTPLPIKSGDIVGVDCPTGAPVPFSNTAPASSTFGFFSAPSLADGSTRSPTNQISNDEELVNADVIGVPVVTSVTPSSGPIAGGTTVTIAGSRLADVTGVTFGGTAASALAVISDSQVEATAPAHAAGPVDVQATDVAGTSPTVPGDAFTYLAPPAPVVTGLAQSHRSWRAGKKLASLARKRRAPVGTTFSFALDGAASVGLTFTQKLAGRSVMGRCVTPTKRNRKQPACKRTVTRGTLTTSGQLGANKVSFQGRITRSKKLGPGRYTLTIGATNAAGLRSAAQTLSFTIVR